MKTPRQLLIAALSAFCSFGYSHAAMIELTGTYVYGERNTDTNVSAIPVSSTDLINGLSPTGGNFSSSWLGGNSTVPMTDGTTGVGSNAAATSSNTLITDAPWYLVYNLPSTSNLTSIVTTSGWADARVNQAFDILVSSDGNTYTSLSDGTTHTTLGEAGVGFYYSAPQASYLNAGSAQSFLNPENSAIGSGGYVATNVNYLAFVSLAQGAPGDASPTNFGSTGYRELDVFAVPEPSTTILLTGAGLVVLLLRKRARIA